MIPGIDQLKKYMGGMTVNLVDSVQNVEILDTVKALAKLRAMEQHIFTEIAQMTSRQNELNLQIDLLSIKLSGDQKSDENILRNIQVLEGELAYLETRATQFRVSLGQVRKVRKETLKAKKIVKAYQAATGLKDVPKNAKEMSIEAAKVFTGLSQLERIPFGIGDFLGGVMDYLGQWIFYVMIIVGICCCAFVVVLAASFTSIENMTITDKIGLGLRCGSDRQCYAEEIVTEQFEEANVNISAE